MRVLLSSRVYDHRRDRFITLLQNFAVLFLIRGKNFSTCAGDQMRGMTTESSVISFSIKQNGKLLNACFFPKQEDFNKKSRLLVETGRK